MLINNGLASTAGCYTYYAVASNQLLLLNNAGTDWHGPVTPGSSGTLSNNQCSINAAQSSASGSGNNLTVSLATSFSSSFAGSKTNYSSAVDNGGLFSGWEARGSWVVQGAAAANAPPSALAVSPSAGSGSSQTFTYTFSDSNGHADLSNVRVLINGGLNSTAGCYGYYVVSTNQLLLLNDAGTAWNGPVNLGSSGTVSNSQCSINAAGSSANGSGNTLTLKLATAFSSGFGGTKTNYASAMDTAGLFSGWEARGSWTVQGAAATNQPPAVVSVSPTSGSGSSRTFTYTFSDPNGYGSLSSVRVLLNGGLNASGGCYVYYAAPSNQLLLLNDAGSGWHGPVTLGSAGTLSNSQCSINSAGSSANGSGNTLTLSLALAFSSSFKGTKQNYGFAVDSGGLLSGWEAKGSWVVP
jgi:hypothetical protein